MTRIDEPKRQVAELADRIGTGEPEGEGARPSGRLVLGIAAFVIVFGALGYAWRGHFEGWAVGPGSPPATSAEHMLGKDQLEALTQKLAERLQAQPDDAEGWSMLGRSYAVLGRYADAATAFRKLIALKPGDAQAHADAADAIGMAQGRQLAGEPEKLIARALELDPDNPKALGLAGTIAFDKGDYALAAKHWERVVKALEPGSPLAPQLRVAIDEARQRAGLPALPPPAGAAPAAADAPRPAASSARVQVRITLAPALATRASPDDTLFVFARALDGGPKAPLAITRRQVKDLPLAVTLDESMAMNPAMSLAAHQRVIVGARISKSGNAIAAAGDLQGLSAPVEVGAQGVEVVIGEVVK